MGGPPNLNHNPYALSSKSHSPRMMENEGSEDDACKTGKVGFRDYMDTQSGVLSLRIETSNGESNVKEHGN